MYCEKCGNEIKDNEQFCEKCGTKVNKILKTREDEMQNNAEKNNTKKPKIKIKLWYIIIIILVILAIYIAFIFCTNDKNKISTAFDFFNKEQNIKTTEKEKKIKYNNTSDLEKLSTTVTLSSGEKWNVNGLDLIFIEALKKKLPEVSIGNGNNAYIEFLTAVGPNIIKGFKINDNIIGGYAIYFIYDEGNIYNNSDPFSVKMPGYYLKHKEFAIKINNWEGLNKIRNIRI